MPKETEPNTISTSRRQAILVSRRRSPTCPCHLLRLMATRRMPCVTVHLGGIGEITAMGKLYGVNVVVLHHYGTKETIPLPPQRANKRWVALAHRSPKNSHSKAHYDYVKVKGKTVFEYEDFKAVEDQVEDQVRACQKRWEAEEEERRKREATRPRRKSKRQKTTATAAAGAPAALSTPYEV